MAHSRGLAFHNRRCKFGIAVVDVSFHKHHSTLPSYSAWPKSIMPTGTSRSSLVAHDAVTLSSLASDISIGLVRMAAGVMKKLIDDVVLMPYAFYSLSVSRFLKLYGISGHVYGAMNRDCIKTLTIDVISLIGEGVISGGHPCALQGAK